VNIRARNFESEIEYRTSRSSGKGGQHLNKTESRVSLFFDVDQSQVLTLGEKERILQTRSSLLNQGKVIQVDVEESRSQWRNKKIALARFYDFLESALIVKPKRKPTKPSKSAERKRLKEKKKRGDLKQNRRKDNLL
jgi:ribosome-associated protein